MFRKLRSFLADVSGNFALTVAVAAPAVVGMAGLAVDYTTLFKHRQSLQEVADSAALAATRELMIAGTGESQIQSVAESYAEAHLPDLSADGSLKVATKVNKKTNKVTVDLAYTWHPMFAHFFDQSATPIMSQAVAKLAGSGLTCVIGMMEPQILAKASIHLDHKAKIVADGCSVHSNSHDTFGLRVDSAASISAESVCSAGGYLKSFDAEISPAPLSDCPKIQDPLAKRKAPQVKDCRAEELVIDKNTTLKPGTYCGGITIKGNARVTLDDGIFVIKDGPLIVTDQANLTGKKASFFLTGEDSIFEFHAGTTISLSAMETGKLAGLLFYEDRNVPHSFNFNPFLPQLTPDDVRIHKISSNNARNLIGTLYLKNSVLLINAEAPVADASAYTALIVGRLWLQEGPTLHLNADYTETEVPVPDGLIGRAPVLVK